MQFVNTHAHFKVQKGIIFGLFELNLINSDVIAGHRQRKQSQMIFICIGGNKTTSADIEEEKLLDEC